MKYLKESLLFFALIFAVGGAIEGNPVKGKPIKKPMTLNPDKRKSSPMTLNPDLEQKRKRPKTNKTCEPPFEYVKQKKKDDGGAAAVIQKGVEV